MSDTIHFSNAIEQVWPFRSPMTHYIQGNIDGRHLFKLYQCCKFFPNRFPFTCISKITNDDGIHTIVHVGTQRLRQSTPKKLWIINEMIFRTRVQGIHDWMKKIHLCTVQNLRIDNPLFFNEFKLLTQAGTIKKISISYICDKRLRRIPIEDLLPMLPNAKIIEFQHAHATPQTAQKLLEINFNHPLKKVCLHGLTHLLDPQLIFDFIKKHSESGSYFCFDYDDRPKNEVNGFCESLKSKVAEWNPVFDAKPTLYAGYYNNSLLEKFENCEF